MFSLREHAADVVNFEKKKMLSLRKKELKSHQDATQCQICSQKFTQKLSKDKNHGKIRNHCHFTCKCRGEAHSICNIRFNVLNEIHIVVHNRSKYDYHLIMKELASESKDKFGCLGEYTEKYKTFSFQQKKK